MKLLMDWVAVDDQVSCRSPTPLSHDLTQFYKSINVVDCPEFRCFVLYGLKNVSEDDLPHHETADVELKKYIIDGMVSIKNGDNLVRFWDVRFRHVLRLTTC